MHWERYIHGLTVQRNNESLVVICRHRYSNHSDCISAKYLLHRCAVVEHLLPVYVDDVSVAMVTL